MLFILLPIYNEEKSIPKVIDAIGEVLKDSDYTIIAVNDGSTDRSFALLKRYDSKRLRIVSYTLNMNIGSVFASGISECLSLGHDGDILVIMEADNTSSVALLPQMTEKIRDGKSDIVIASRYVKGGGYRRFPFKRLMISYAANFFMKTLFRVKHVSDYTIFFRAYRFDTIRKAAVIFGRFGLIQSKGFLANAELLVKLSCLTNKIREVPFVYDYGQKKGGSKLKIIPTGIEYLLTVPYLSDVRKRIRERSL